MNRRDFIEVNNITRLVERRGKLFVYKQAGYPKIIKADLKLTQFLMRIANMGGDFSNIPVIKE